MKKSNNELDFTTKLLLTCLAGLFLLHIIAIVFFQWYRQRRRREEKLRQSQQIEESFSDRLAASSVPVKSSRQTDVGFASQEPFNVDPEKGEPRAHWKSSSKFDVGFTSQQTINADPDPGERRPALSRFLRLWKGLRNSKRKSANHEQRKNVVFTIPTNDVFPKKDTRQQTQLGPENHDIYVDGFVTHMCEVHRVNHHPGDEYSDHELRHADGEPCVLLQNEISHHKELNVRELESTRRCNVSEKPQGNTMSMEGQGSSPQGAKSEENNLEKKQEKGSSKESDVDSGCGSSCHEMNDGEQCTAPAQKNENEAVGAGKETPQFQESLESDQEAMKVISVPSCETPLGDVEIEVFNSAAQHANKHLTHSTIKENSFEDLIQLAKDGMSTLARKKVDNGDKNPSKRAQDCFQNLTNTDNCDKSQDIPLKNKTAEKQTNENDHVKDARTCFEIKDVDSRVICASSGFGPSRNDSKKHFPGAFKEKTGNSYCPETCVVQIPPLERSRVKYDDNNFECSTKKLEVDRQRDTIITIEDSELISTRHKAVAFQNQIIQRSQESLQKTGRSEKMKGRPQSLIVSPSHEERTDTAMFTLKVPSLDTLPLPSQAATKELSESRTRSFSATIRRKLSFREKQTSDDTDVEKHKEKDGNRTPKHKKLKGFRSFRANKKSKAKAIGGETRSTAGGVSSSDLLSAIDKFFPESTESALFSNVPFTIPEISEQ